ncbi:MAG: hypothetical protein P0116_02345 [Candidatus Nitrosocosmicus sp.]|nr:hypothetical protein [Candidatus Nitrosocosmicus sp.]
MLGSLKSNNANEFDMTKIVKLRVIPPPDEGTRTVLEHMIMMRWLRESNLNRWFVEVANSF